MEQTENIKLPYIAAAQAQKHVTHNEALRILDTVIQMVVLDQDLIVPPVSPVNGECYIVANEGGGEWLGKGHQIATFVDNSWFFYQPRIGWVVWVIDEEKLYVFDGSVWVEGVPSVNPASLVGINVTADNTNKLSVKSDAVLFSHDDVTPGNGSVQVKVNKSEIAGTASLLYQTGWSGRAEMGLMGDDDFHFKVSSDGNTWNEAIIINKSTGSVSFPNSTTGGAVSNAPVTVIKEQVNRFDPAFKMTGLATDNSLDNSEGVGLYLTANSVNNRQFVIAETQNNQGVRFNGRVIDGSSNGQVAPLSLGSQNSRIHVSFEYANAKFSVSNWSSDPAKSVCSLLGASLQTGNYFEITSKHFGATVGDVLKVTADKKIEFGGTVRLQSYTIATLPPAIDAGAMIFVTDEVGGAVMAFCDGSNWLRCTDRTIVSA